MLANSDSPTTSNFLAGIFNTLIMSLLVPFFWQTPSLLHGLMMIALGGCGMGGHLLLTQAFRHAPPATLAPFSYGQIIFAGLLGLLVFGHVGAARHPRHLRQRPGGRLAPWPLNATGRRVGFTTGSADS